MRKLILCSVLLGVSCASAPNPVDKSLQLESSENITPPKASPPRNLYPYPARESCWSGERVANLSECPPAPEDVVSFRIVTEGRNFGDVRVWMNRDNILGKMELDVPTVTPAIRYELRRNLYRLDNQTQARYSILHSFLAPVEGTDELRPVTGSSVLETDQAGNAVIRQSRTHRATKHDPFLRCVVNAVREHIISKAAPLDLVTNCDMIRTP